MRCLTADSSTQGTDEVEATFTSRVRQVSTEMLLRCMGRCWSTLEKTGHPTLRVFWDVTTSVSWALWFLPQGVSAFVVLFSSLPPPFVHPYLLPSSFPSFVLPYLLPSSLPSFVLPYLPTFLPPSSLPFSLITRVANFRTTSRRTFSPSTV